MYKFAAVTAVLFLLYGCATPAELESKTAELNNTIPTCKEARECELKWSAGRSFILRNSTVKIQTMRDDYIETYGTGDSASLWFRLVKEPVAEGGYRLLIATGCGNIFGCVPNAMDTAISFNKEVNAIKLK